MNKSHALRFTRLRRAVTINLAFEFNLAFIRHMYAGQRFDERGFSCSVFTEQRQHFARI